MVFVLDRVMIGLRVGTATGLGWLGATWESADVGGIDGMGGSATGSGIIARCFLFLLSLPEGVSTQYDLGVSASETTVPWLCWETSNFLAFNQTRVPSGMESFELTLCLLLYALVCFSLNRALLRRKEFKKGQFGVSWDSV